MPEIILYVAFAPQNDQSHEKRKVETMITVRLKAMLSLRMRKTSLCHVDPLLYSDGLALNTVRCCPPGCILNSVLRVNPLLLNSENKNTSPFSFSRPLTSPHAFTPRWRYSICYDGHTHLSRSSVLHKRTEQLRSDISEVVTSQNERRDTYRVPSAHPV